MLRHRLTLTAMPSSSAPSASPGRPRRPSAANLLPPSASSSSSSSSATCCNHSSPSATLDLLILILVLFSCTFLISSSFAYIFRSLSQILPSLLQPLAECVHQAPLPFAAGLLVFLAASLAVAAEISCGGRGGGGRAGRRGSWLGWWWSRRCGNPRCRGLKKALEFDVQLQTEESVRAAAVAPDAALWREIDGLPWKGGDKGNSPEYECLRVELRKMAPPNGRAVLLFRSRCGCPVAKLEAWGPKRGRRHKKSASTLALEGER